MTDFDTKWDVDKYYDETEPEAHWDLRKEFMILHKKRYPEQYLVALAKVFTNVEFMGCSYSKELMALIADLSRDVADSYRKQKSTKLQRTFVKASDAAESKFSVNKKFHKLPSSKSTLPSTNIVDITTEQTKKSDLIQKVQAQEGFRGKLVLVQLTNNTPWKLIQDAAFNAKVTVSINETGKRDHDDNKGFNITMDGEIIADGFAKTEKEAKNILAVNALKNLQQTCFTIERKILPLDNGESITKNSDSISKVEESNPFSSDSIGSAMMKRMGWSGKGLGKNENGRENCIDITEYASRSGFGCTERNENIALRKKLKEYVFKYATSNKTHNLIFSSDFTADERKFVHNLANKFKLKSKSYGKKSARQLVISRKITTWDLVQNLLDEGDFSSEYNLIIPTNFK